LDRVLTGFEGRLPAMTAASQALSIKKMDEADPLIP
jgi:hypothetical protein